MAGAPLQKTRYPGIFRRGEKYVVVARKRDGGQVKRTVSTIAEAKQTQAVLKADILRGQHQDGHKLTFAEYALDWIETYQGRTTKGFREPTRVEYRRSIEKKAIPWFEKNCPRLVDAEPRVLRQFVKHLQSEGRSLATVRNHFNVVRAMYATAVEDGLMQHNPCSVVRVSRVESGTVVKPRQERRALGEQEITAFLAEAGEWRLFFEFMIHTGLRIGEALELKWSDIDFGKRLVLVRRQTRRGVTSAPKSEAGNRDVPLATGLSQRLWAAQGAPGAPVFAHPATGEHMTYHWADHNILKKTRKAAGLDWVTFHSLRHTAASVLFTHGKKNAVQVQHWIGHADASFTQRTYIHLMDDGMGDADFLDDVTAVNGLKRGEESPGATDVARAEVSAPAEVVGQDGKRTAEGATRGQRAARKAGFG